MAASAPVSPTARRPRRAQRGNECGVVPAGQDGDDHVERGCVGDAETVDETRFEPASAQLGVDRPAATMHDDQRPLLRERRDRHGHRRASRPRSSSSSPPSLSTVASRIPVAPSSASRTSALPHPALIQSLGFGRPNTTLKFWIACPAAPFTRLSMQATITSCEPSTRKPMSQKFVCATCLISGRSAAGQADERGPVVRIGQQLFDVGAPLRRAEACA